MKLIYNSHQQTVFAESDDFDASPYDWHCSIPLEMVARGEPTIERLCAALARDARGEASEADTRLAELIGRRIVREKTAV